MRHAICRYYHGLCANFQDIGFLISLSLQKIRWKYNHLSAHTTSIWYWNSLHADSPSKYRRRILNKLTFKCNVSCWMRINHWSNCEQVNEMPSLKARDSMKVEPILYWMVWLRFSVHCAESVSSALNWTACKVMLINKYFQFVCKVVFAVGQGFEVTINTTSSVCNKLATSISSIGKHWNR